MGILNLSTVLANTNEFGGIIHSETFLLTKFVALKFLGSTTSELTLVNILNSSATLASYPNEDKPYEILSPLTCFSSNGVIIPSSLDIFLIHLSERTDII